MAGTLVISTLSDGTNSTSSTNCIQGSAKAWVNFNGYATPSIRASYNVSSITYNAGGDYYVNFTNAFADTSYAVLMTSYYDDAVALNGTARVDTTSRAKLLTYNNIGAYPVVNSFYQSPNIYLAAFR